jgi:hypothetical protein
MIYQANCFVKCLHLFSYRFEQNQKLKQDGIFVTNFFIQ